MFVSAAMPMCAGLLAAQIAQAAVKAKDPVAASHLRYQAAMLVTGVGIFALGAMPIALRCLLTLIFAFPDVVNGNAAKVFGGEPFPWIVAGGGYMLASLWLLLGSLFGAFRLLSGKPMWRLRAA
jgi:hypothetical protein